MSKIGNLDREELLQTILHYKKLEVIFFDENETIVFL